MSVSLDEMNRIASKNLAEAAMAGHVELAVNALDVWISTTLEIIALESLMNRADIEDPYEGDDRK